MLLATLSIIEFIFKMCSNVNNKQFTVIDVRSHVKIMEYSSSFKKFSLLKFDLVRFISILFNTVV